MLLQGLLYVLEKRRELLDCFADHLLRYDLIRQYEIDQIAENFGGLEGIVEESRWKGIDTRIADAKTQLPEEHQWRNHPATPVIVIHTDQSKEAKAKKLEGSKSRRPRSSLPPSNQRILREVTHYK